MTAPATLLFAVDHVFQRGADGAVYTVGGKFPHAAWEPYLEAFDEVVVISRGRALDPASNGKLSLSSGERVRHHLVGGRRGLRRLMDVASDVRAVRDAVMRADAVVGRVPSEFGLTACAEAGRLGKPYMVEVVACPWDALWNHGSLAARAYAPILTRRMAAVVRSAPVVRYVTAEFLQRRYPTQGQALVASNVMLSERAPEAALSTRGDKLVGIERGARPLVFGTVGSLTTRLKGVDLALSALGALRERLPELQYRVLGEGDPAPFRARAEALGLGDVVFFDGVLPAGGAVFDWLDGIDVYLQPSYQEGLPRGLIEAMSRGCLAIGSTAGGIPELLPPDRLHRPGDAMGLADRIIDLWGASAEAKIDEIESNLRGAGEFDRGVLMARRARACSELRASVDKVFTRTAA